MKDSTATAICGMACTTAIYGVYLVTGAVSNTLAPDGLILSGAVGAIVALATGTTVALRKAKNGG